MDNDDKNKLYFIVNPVSGSGEGMRRFAIARGLLEKRNAEYGFCYSEYPGHAVKLAKQAIENGERNIVAVGGDGTLNEVASVVKDHKGVRLGLLPFGTGNDFARGIGLPEDEEGLVDALLSGNTRMVDAGAAGDGFFMNVAGFGFDVDVVRYTEKYKRKLNGMLPYMLGILKALIYLSKTEAEIETDSGESFSVTAILLSACNGTRFAGGINLAPQAEQSDGLLDICILKKVNMLRFLYLLPKYMKGKHLKYKDFMYFKAKSIRVDTASNMPMECDGEIMGHTPAVFRVLENAIELMIGE